MVLYLQYSVNCSIQKQSPMHKVLMLMRFFLFSESQSRVLVSCDPSSADSVKKTAQKIGTPIYCLGKVTQGKFTISVGGQRWIDLLMRDVKQWWASGFEKGVFKS